MTGTTTRQLLRAAMMALSLAMGAGVQAQPAQPPHVQGPAAPAQPAAQPNDGPGTAVSAETKAARAKLDGYKAELDQKELSLQGRALSDTDLQGLRDQIEPLAQNISEIIDQQAPRLEASRARLTQLGP